MRKALFLFSVLFALAGFTAALAQETTVPCCAGGARPNKKCELDSDCPGACVGGARDGKPCSQAGCPDACEGGADAGKNCDADADCRSACVGGTRDGQVCGEPNGPGCPGGACENAGTCSNAGECVSGTCSAVCLVRSKSKKPDNPTSSIVEYPVCYP